jgi:hypothetical protein
MIRMQTKDGWFLITHKDHARLAGEIGGFWGNATFAEPSPRAQVLHAVTRHDDAWASRDATPALGEDGTPAAFSKDLVGTYSAFENIDLAEYLHVRGEAAKAVADEDPLAAILISMHTVNLLTDQADLSSLGPADRSLHADFIKAQQQLQEDLRQALPLPQRPSETTLQTAFHFLQACDSLSLMACAGYPDAMDLRHQHPTNNGETLSVHAVPEGSGFYRLEPFPLKVGECRFSVPALAIRGHSFSSEADFREALQASRRQFVHITVHR